MLKSIAQNRKQLKSINMGQEVFYMRGAKWKWFAIDANCIGHLYTHCPEVGTPCDWTVEGVPLKDWDYTTCGQFDLTGIDWRETLTERQTT